MSVWGMSIQSKSERERESEGWREGGRELHHLGPPAGTFSEIHNPHPPICRFPRQTIFAEAGFGGNLLRDELVENKLTNHLAVVITSSEDFIQQQERHAS